MTVSVIMPAFNVERWVDEAVRSIREQDHADFELIVDDDGSSDATADIVERHARDDPRVRLFRLKQRSGSANARNYAFEQSRFDLLAVMDADDVADRNRLSRQLTAFRARRAAGVPLGVLAAHERLIDGDGHVLNRGCKPSTVHGDVTDRLLKANCLIHSSVVMSREAFVAAGRYRSEFQTSQDYDLWLRIREKFRIEILDDVLISYRLHDRAASVVSVRRQIVDGLAARASAVARARGLPEPIGAARPDGEALAKLVGLSTSFEFYLARELSKRARHFARFGSPKVARNLRGEAMEVFRSGSGKWPFRERAEILVRLGQSLLPARAR